MNTANTASVTKSNANSTGAVTMLLGTGLAMVSMLSLVAAMAPTIMAMM